VSAGLSLGAEPRCIKLLKEAPETRDATTLLIPERFNVVCPCGFTRGPVSHLLALAARNSHAESCPKATGQW
jgi:hypothetical protein